MTIILGRRWSERGLVARPGLVASLGAALAVLAMPIAPARATVTPSSGGPRAAFEIVFPAQPVVLDLQPTGPGRCGELDDLSISIRGARTGRVRFGPRVPGARPRRDGTRLRRWCRGRYRVSVIRSDEFEPGASHVISHGRFTVK